MAGSWIVLMTSSSGIFILNSLETGHFSLGNFRKLGLFCQGVSFLTSSAVQLVLVGRSAGFKVPAICCSGSKLTSGYFCCHSWNFPLTTALLLARYGFNKRFLESAAEIVHSDSRQKVTKVGKSLILDRTKSTSLVPSMRQFISVLGTVIPLRGAMHAFDKRRGAS